MLRPSFVFGGGVGGASKIISGGCRSGRATEQATAGVVLATHRRQWLALYSTTLSIRARPSLALPTCPVGRGRINSRLRSFGTKRTTALDGSVDNNRDDNIVEGSSWPSSPSSPLAIHELLLSRRTVKNFAPTLPDNWPDLIRTAVEAATYAPNHKRTEPWRFRLLGPSSIRKVCVLNAEMVTAKKGSALAGEKKLERWLKVPGWLVVTCQYPKVKNQEKKKENENKKDRVEAINPHMEKAENLAQQGVSDDNDKSTSSIHHHYHDDSMDDPMSRAREDYAACCCAIQNLCLSLHANGLGTAWTTGAVNFDDRFADIVGIDTAKEYVVGTVWFGTPAAAADNRLPKPPRKRNKVDDVLIRVD